jgi:hypothetical protein
VSSFGAPAGVGQRATARSLRPTSTPGICRRATGLSPTPRIIDVNGYFEKVAATS